MKKSNTVAPTTIKEEPKMKKYIVEAEEPKEGEEVSTGGIRKNGKMASQFKNPVPYEEPALAPIVKKSEESSLQNVPTYTLRDRMKDEAKGFAVNVGSNIMSMLWYRFGKPYLETKLTHFVDRLVSTPEETPRSSAHNSAPDVIDVDAEELIPVDESSDKIIKFPNKRVG